MPINRRTIPAGDAGREEWFGWRKPHVTGSQVAAMFGCSPFLTHYALYAEKAGLAELPPPDSDVLERGEILEPAIALAVQKERPDWRIEKATDYFWSDEWRLGCTPDYNVYCPKRGGPGVLENKSVAGPEYDAKWQDGPPEYVLLQTLLQGMLTGVSWMAIGVLVIRNPYKFERKVFEFDRHPEAEERIIDRAAEFWAAIEAGVVPQPDYAKDGPVIRALYRDGGAAPIDLSRHNRISFLCEEKLAWAKRASASEKALEVINSEITDILGHAERGDHPTFNITCKGQWSGGGSAPPRKKIRVLRVTRKKTAANDDGEDQQEAA